MRGTWTGSDGNSKRRMIWMRNVERDGWGRGWQARDQHRTILRMCICVCAPVHGGGGRNRHAEVGTGK